MSKIKDRIKDKIAGSVIDAVQRTDVNADLQAAGPITEAVNDAVGPIVDHLTNQEPFYQSRTFWGLVLLVLTRELALRGYAIPQEYHGELLTFMVSYGPYLAVALIGWGRWIAKKPLFSGWFKKASG